jgi:hypothetical protein
MASRPPSMFENVGKRPAPPPAPLSPDKAVLRSTRPQSGPQRTAPPDGAPADWEQESPAPPPRPPVNGRTAERPNERSPLTRIVRQSYDIRDDQRLALAEIQAKEFAVTGRKPKMGEMAQAAFDLYIASKRDEYERTNE